MTGSHAPHVTARSWAAAPPSWSEDQHWITERMTIDGVPWFSRIHPDGDPELPPIVMIHGLVVSGSYFRPIAGIMDHRYRIYVPDLPGHGHSGSDRMWALPSLVTQLGLWMDAHDLAGSVIVGNSLGCQIATLLAVDRPELVRAMILIGPTLDPAITNPIQLMLRGAVDIPRERQSLWSIWIPDLLRAGIRRALFMLHQLFADDQLGRLGNVRQPAFVIGGECDPVATPRWIRDMASRMPRGEAIVVSDASHALNYSNAPEVVAAIERATGLPISESPGS